jgi:hypothetical protein
MNYIGRRAGFSPKPEFIFSRVLRPETQDAARKSRRGFQLPRSISGIFGRVAGKAGKADGKPGESRVGPSQFIVIYTLSFKK